MTKKLTTADHFEHLIKRLESGPSNPDSGGWAVYIIPIIVLIVFASDGKLALGILIFFYLYVFLQVKAMRVLRAEKRSFEKK